MATFTNAYNKFDFNMFNALRKKGYLNDATKTGIREIGKLLFNGITAENYNELVDMLTEVFADPAIQEGVYMQSPDGKNKIVWNTEIARANSIYGQYFAQQLIHYTLDPYKHLNIRQSGPYMAVKKIPGVVEQARTIRPLEMETGADAEARTAPLPMAPRRTMRRKRKSARKSRRLQR
jgi:hypothetical protein